MKIFLIGFMGCGKTHWGRQLSQKLNLPFFDLDEKIVEKEEKSITQIFAEEGEEYFRLLEKDVLHLITENHESFIMACGGGTPCFFNTIEYIKKQGTVVWFNCTLNCLFSRLVKEKEKRPLIKDLNDEQLRSYIIKKYSSRKIFYEQAHIIINDEELDLDQLVDRVFHP
ncbi:MAG: shikimate kinase [Flavisolibacter sp.]|nr:shikimate kinase [Flavisolibacter sp.]MBD0295247.1 shikimate kinase [Flavisolibacter sp.]MBD0364993.1 shikimate kinase [Flavisolibacter sp.]MBD0377392.1 shikimate kinase [Flavisolibacter sp.]